MSRAVSLSNFCPSVNSSTIEVSFVFWNRLGVIHGWDITKMDSVYTRDTRSRCAGYLKDEPSTTLRGPRVKSSFSRGQRIHSQVHSSDSLLSIVEWSKGWCSTRRSTRRSGATITGCRSRGPRQVSRGSEAKVLTGK